MNRLMICIALYFALHSCARLYHGGFEPQRRGGTIGKVLTVERYDGQTIVETTGGWTLTLRGEDFYVSVGDRMYQLDDVVTWKGYSAKVLQRERMR